MDEQLSPLSQTTLLGDLEKGCKSQRFALGSEPNIVSNLTVAYGISSPVKSSPVFTSSGMSSYSASGEITSLKLVYDASATSTTNHLIAKAGTIVWMASVSGALATGSVLNWTPLIGAVSMDVSGRTVSYIHERGNTGTESIIQYGAQQYNSATYTDVYIASDIPTNTDNCYKWGGLTYNIGTISCTGSTATGATFNVSGGNFISGGILPGDILYLYNTSAGKWRCTSGHPGYVVNNVTPTQIDTYTTSGNIEYTTGQGAASGEYVSYVIQRVMPLGINLPGSSGQIVNQYDTMYRSTSVSGETPSGAPYYEVTCSYVYRYGDYRTNTWTDYSTAASNSTTGVKNRISGWITEPDDPRLNTLEIYRAPYDTATSGAGAYSKLTTMYRTLDGTYSHGMTRFESSYSDEVAKITVTADNTLTGYDLAHGKPYYNAIRGLYLYAGRLMGTQVAWGDFSKKQLVMSHLAQLSHNYSQFKGFEYWNWRTDSADTGNILETGGGWLNVGSGSEVITSLRSDGNAYNLTGLTDASLLIFTNKHLYRLHGSTWSTFNLSTVSRIDGPQYFPHTCSLNGTVYWLSKSGIYSLNAGGNTPTLLSSNVFPQGLTDQDLSTWELIPFGEDLLISGTITGITASALGLSGKFSMLYQNGAFTIINQAVRTADYLNSPDSNIVALGANGTTIYAFLSGDEAVPCKYKSMPLVIGGAASLLSKAKYINEIDVYMHPDTIDRVITVNVFDHAGSGSIKSVTGTVTASTDVNVNKLVKLYPEEAFVRPSVELTWTGTHNMSLNYIVLSSRVEGSNELFDEDRKAAV